MGKDTYVMRFSRMKHLINIVIFWLRGRIWGITMTHHHSDRKGELQALVTSPESTEH